MDTTISMAELRSTLTKMEPQEKQKAMELLSKIGVDLSTSRGDLTGSGVQGFIFNNFLHPAYSHKDAFVRLMNIIVMKYPDRRDLLFGIKGRKKTYFSRSVGDFKGGCERLSGTDIYVDINDNAAQLNRRCQRVLQAFGIDPASYIVIPK